MANEPLFQSSRQPAVPRVLLPRYFCHGLGLTAVPLLHNTTAIYIDLSDNAVTSIPAATFVGFTMLQYLDLDTNPLTSLPPTLLAGLASLQILRV